MLQSPCRAQAARRLPDAAVAGRPRGRCRRRRPGAGGDRASSPTRPAATVASSPPPPAGCASWAAARCSSASTSTARRSPRRASLSPARRSCSSAATPWPAQWRPAVDLVVGNPPFLSQLASATTRRGASRHGGGPYADAAVEFLALGAAHAASRRPPRARAAAVDPRLPRRRAGAGRARSARRHRLVVVVARARLRCPGPGVRDRRRGRAHRPGSAGPTSSPTRSAVPPLPPLGADGALGDRCRLTANFRDQYYGLVPAVVEDGAGPRLVTSGLIDPGRTTWGVTPDDVRPPPLPAPDRRPRPAGAVDAALGRRPARAQGARRQPDPGRSRPSSTPTAAGCRACRRSRPALARASTRGRSPRS